MNVKNSILDFLDSVFIDSKSTKTIIKSISALAHETKNLMSIALRLSERLDNHEKVLTKLVEMQENKDRLQTTDFPLPRKSKEKPN